MQLLGEDSGYNENAICYLSCNKELDKALEYLLDELQKANKLDNTVIVLTGDHYPYYFLYYFINIVIILQKISYSNSKAPV